VRRKPEVRLGGLLGKEYRHATQNLSFAER
jgi:hypothetical protein